MLMVLGAAAIVAFALVVPVARALINEKPLQVKKFRVEPDNLQAGKSPNVRIVMRFCNDGIPIVHTTGKDVSPIVLTTGQPVSDFGLAVGDRRFGEVIGVRGNSAANGIWGSNSVDQRS